jgi:hypothetical protein
VHSLKQLVMIAAVVAAAAGVVLVGSILLPDVTRSDPDPGPGLAGVETTPPEVTSVPEPPTPSVSPQSEAIDYEVAEAYMRQLTGSHCSASFDATIAITDALITEAEARPADANEWLQSGVWLGSGDALREELGGELIAARPAYIWIAVPGEDGPYAQLLLAFTTENGRTIWFLAGSVKSLDPSACS